MIHNLTYPMLDRKFPKSNTIAMSQHYMVRLLSNPYTSYGDRRTALAYIRDHPERFTAYPEDTGNPVADEEAKKRNGNGAVEDFIAYAERAFGDRP